MISSLFSSALCSPRCTNIKEYQVQLVKSIRSQLSRFSQSCDKLEHPFPYNDFAKKEIVRKKVEGSYRSFVPMSRTDTTSWLNHALGLGRETKLTLWTSADCLGIGTHPALLSSVIKGIQEAGLGTGGSRWCANSVIHQLLEQEVAALHKKERGLLFNSGFVANESAISALAKALPGCVIFSDEANHASLVAGAVNSRVTKQIFLHNDAADLERSLSQVEPGKPKIVIFESIHSMEGTICSIKNLCEVAKKYGALTFLDEAHAIGLYGHGGGGISELEEVVHNVDIVSGSLNKAHGAVGGYIAGNDSIVDLIRCNAPGFIFTAALPPAILCGAIEAIRILASEEGRSLRQLMVRNTEYMRERLVEANIPVSSTKSHFIPILVGNPNVSTSICQRLLECGHFLPAMNEPTVPRGSERFRLMPSSHHSQHQMDDLLKHFLIAWNEAWKSHK